MTITLNGQRVANSRAFLLASTTEVDYFRFAKLLIYFPTKDRKTRQLATHLRIKLYFPARKDETRNVDHAQTAKTRIRFYAK